MNSLRSKTETNIKLRNEKLKESKLKEEKIKLEKEKLRIKNKKLREKREKDKFEELKRIKLANNCEQPYFSDKKYELEYATVGYCKQIFELNRLLELSGQKVYLDKNVKVAVVVF